MMDRLVCADEGNPDPTTTHGKTPEEAKALELKGWDYPKHLKGRIFSVIAHGDTVGADRVCAALQDWLLDLELVPAGAMALLIATLVPTSRMPPVTKPWTRTRHSWKKPGTPRALSWKR